MTGKKSVKFACAESRRLVRADTAFRNIAPPRAAERTAANVRLVDSDGFSRNREVFLDMSGWHLLSNRVVPRSFFVSFVKSWRFQRAKSERDFLFEGRYEKHKQIRETIFRTAGRDDGLGEKIRR